MRAALAIASREIRAYFFTATGWVVLFLFLLITGTMFIAQVFDQGAVASLRPVFEYGAWMLLFIAPAITMRLLSEEYRLGTFETLMTSPVTETSIVLGKFLASVAFLVVLLAPTLLYVVALERYGTPGPDYGELACGYAGMLLAGGAYLATGVLASALTGSQVIAYLGTLFFWLALSLGTAILPPYLDDRGAGIVIAMNPDPRLRDFAIGLVDSANIVYFLSFVVVGLLAAVMVLQWRRSR